MKTILFALLAIVALGGLLFAYGASLPGQVQSVRAHTLKAPVSQVYGLVTDVGGQARWRSDVGAVSVEDGGRRWTEETKQGVLIAFEEIERTPPSRFEIAFASPQGFSGRWIGVFESAPDGTTRVTFTETVRTESPIGRLMQRVLAPPGAHIDRYIQDLDAALQATPG